MGGAAAGEVASAIAVDVIAREVEGGAPLDSAFAEANRSILPAAAAGPGGGGLGSTGGTGPLSGSERKWRQEGIGVVGRVVRRGPSIMKKKRKEHIHTKEYTYKTNKTE